jgi:hypothetical protein
MNDFRGCKCIKIKNVFPYGIDDILSEIGEFILAIIYFILGMASFYEILDEFSDVMFGVGRLIGGVFGILYISMPFDGIHIKKINKRFLEYGCCRSKRYLINDRCPSI